MGYRIERDFLGEGQIPDDADDGIQTLRGKENFSITGMPMSREPYFVKGFGYVKKAAAMAVRDLGILDARIAEAVMRACDRLIAGEMLDQFVTDFIQGGAGTSTNMNASEVIANLALESLGHRKGEYHHGQVLKMGRTHLQDAVPMSLGAEPRLGDDDRRGGAANRRGPEAPAVCQPRGHRRPHRHQVHPRRGPHRGHKDARPFI